MGQMKKGGKGKIERAATEEQLNLLAAKIPISNRSYTRTQASKLIVENPQKPNWGLRDEQELTVLQALLRSQMGELQRLGKALQAEDLDDDSRSELEDRRDDLVDDISRQEESIREHKQDEQERLLEFQEAMIDDYESFHEVIKKPSLSQVKQACAALDAQNPHWDSYREGLPEPNEVLCNALLTKFPSLRRASAKAAPNLQYAPRTQSSSHSKKKGKCGCLFLFVLVLAVGGVLMSPKREQPQNASKSGPTQRAEELDQSAQPNNSEPKVSAPLVRESRIFTEERLWTDRKGRKLTAALIRLFKMDDVYHGDFQKTDGDVFTYKIGNFSDEDVNFVKGLLKVETLEEPQE